MSIRQQPRSAVMIAAVATLCSFVMVAAAISVPYLVDHHLAYFLVGRLFAVALLGLLLAVGALRYYWWFSCDYERFSFGEQRLFGKRGASYRLDDYVSMHYENGDAHLRMADGTLVRLPEALQKRTEEIVVLLRAFQAEREGLSAFGFWNRPHTPLLAGTQDLRQVPWPDPFLHQYEKIAGEAENAESYDEAIVDDPNALQALIARYRKAVIFHDALPPAFELAKMFTTLRESNGGLVLFGVSPDGSIVGLNGEDLRRAREKLEHLAANLTEARVEIGRIDLQGKAAAFAVFNLIPSHLRPMAPFAAATSEVVVV